jgi:hypothetical protein
MINQKITHSPAMEKNLLIQNSDRAFGNMVYDSKNIVNVVECRGSENVRHSHTSVESKNSQDISRCAKSDLELESISSDYGYRTVFADDSETCTNSAYSDICDKSSFLFACIGVRNKEYCIFNKQYTKEEYEQLVPKIIEHMIKTGERGQFFDPALSPFGYNETMAVEYFPLSKDEAVIK